MSTGKPVSETPADRRLRARHKRFLEEYVANDFNAVRAYMKVFRESSYSSAAEASSRLLKTVKIQEELKAIQDEYARQVRVSRAKVLKELAIVAFSDIGEAFIPSANRCEPDSVRPLSRMRPTIRRAIQSAKTKKRRIRGKDGDVAEEVEEVEYKLYSKLDALDKLCKKLGLFKDEEKPAETLTEAQKIELLKAILGTPNTTEGGK